MGSESEPAKLLLPYLQRADELQKHEPLVAYYCRLYAMERGLKISPKDRTKTTNALLTSLMNQLEKDKKSLKLGNDDSLYLEGFASNVFSKADKQDRAGRADLNTAKTFYAASIFFEIINQFGELQTDLEQKQKYAVWKAADIRKALKEGRKPEPGPPGGEEDLSSSPVTSYDAGQDENLGQSESFAGSQPRLDTSSRPADDTYTHQNSSYAPSSLPSYPTSDYPAHDFSSPLAPPAPSPPPSSPPPPPPPPLPTNRPESTAYHQTYQHAQAFPSDQNYPSHMEPRSYNYANFQSYPSFHESSLPASSGNYPSYHQGFDGPYSHPQPGPELSNYPVAPPYNAGSKGEIDSRKTSQSAFSFSYDVNYKPPPEKISEAHKAAKFAVGALAFDDVPVAVDFLKQALELLTKPSAGQ